MAHDFDSRARWLKAQDTNDQDAVLYLSRLFGVTEAEAQRRYLDATYPGGFAAWYLPDEALQKYR